MSLDLLEQEMVTLNTRLKELANNEVTNVTEWNNVKNLLLQKSSEVNALFNQTKTLMAGITPAPLDKKILIAENGSLAYVSAKTINGQSITGEGDIVVATQLPDFKTINGEAITGTGDIVVATDISSKADISYVDTKVAELASATPGIIDTINTLSTALQNDESVIDALNLAVVSKQDKLESGVNIKTINGSSILGNGDLVIAAGGGGSSITGNSLFEGFAVTKNDTQSLTAGSNTKITFNTVEFDTNNLYDLASNKFIVKTTGYYNLGATVGVQTTACRIIPVIYKNGSILKIGSDSSSSFGESISTLLYLTAGDYLEFYLQVTTGQNVSTNYRAYFFASLAGTNALPSSTLSIDEFANYSNDEVLTEKRWIDGKPIYRKVVSISAGVINSAGKDKTIYTFPYKVSMVNAHGICTGGTSAGFYKLTRSFLELDPTGLAFYVYMDSSEWSINSTYNFIIEYTKESDTATSPVALPKITKGTIELPNYTTTETLTERRWVDGKPIYKKTYIKLGSELNAPGSAKDLETFTYDISLVSSEAFARNTTSGSTYNLARSWIQQNNPKNINISLESNEYTVANTYYITIYYTKASDNSSSPTALSSFVKAEGTAELPRYSTTEILTSERWIDGKPIYRKVYTFSSPVASETLIDTTINSTNNNIVNSWINSRDAAGNTFTVPANLATTASHYSYLSPSGLYLLTPSSWIESRLIIYYTKASDTSASPVALISAISTTEGKLNYDYNISSSEYIIPGKFRNGKQVYGIEIDCGALPNASVKTVSIPNYNSNYQYLINGSESYSSGTSSTISLPYASPVTNQSLELVIDKTSGNLRFTTLIDWSAYTTTKVVLEYTK